MKISGSQLLLIVAAILLTFLLYWLPTNKNSVWSQPLAESGKSVIEDQIKAAKDKLTSETKNTDGLQHITLLESRLSKEHSVALLDSLGIAWDVFNQSAIAANYFEKSAEIKALQMIPDSVKEKAWINAAYRYFDVFKAGVDSATKINAVNKAIYCYNKVILINPGNLNAKTDLGVCYAEGTSQPMQGIMLLREVVAANPNHENAQLNLGFLSMRSGQYAKAVKRFETVLKINPANRHVHCYLAQAYEKLGDNNKAAAEQQLCKGEME